MAQRRLAVPSKEAQVHLVSRLGAFKAPRVQRVNINTDIPSTTVDELGNASHVGDAKDTPNVTLTFSAFDTGIKIFSALTATDSAAYPALGVDISALGEVDALIYIKDSIASDYVKTCHARRLQIRDFTFSYSVDGESTEDYTAIGSEKRWFSRDVVVDRFTTGTTSFSLSQTPIELKNGNALISVILDGAYLTEVASTPDEGEYSVSGTTVTTGDSMVTDMVAVYQANPAGDNWADVADSSMPAAIRGKDVTVSIAAAGIDRVQSVTINGTMSLQPVREMGSKNIIGYERQVPDVTGTITVLDTDVELLSLLQYGVPVSGTEYTPGDGCVSTGVDLKIELRDPCDDTAPYTILKTVYLDSITVVGDSWASTVNQNATQTINFKSITAHCVVYSGSM